MARRNYVEIEGRLTATPDLRYTPRGEAVLELKFAIGNGSAKRRKRVGGLNFGAHGVLCVTAKGHTAETCEVYLNKGDRVHIVGRMGCTLLNVRLSEYSKAVIIADAIDVLGKSGLSRSILPVNPWRMIQPAYREFQSQIQKSASLADAVRFLDAAVGPFIRLYERYRVATGGPSTGLQAMLWQDADKK